MILVRQMQGLGIGTTSRYDGRTVLFSSCYISCHAKLFLLLPFAILYVYMCEVKFPKGEMEILKRN